MFLEGPIKESAALLVIVLPPPHTLSGVLLTFASLPRPLVAATLRKLVLPARIGSAPLLTLMLTATPSK